MNGSSGVFIYRFHFGCDGDSNFAQSNPPHDILQLSFSDPSVSSSTVARSACAAHLFGLATPAARGVPHGTLCGALV